MNLRILKCASTEDHPIYRGTDRMTPYYVDEVDQDHPVNQAFFWSIEEGGDLGIVHDLHTARELVQLYRKIEPPQCFEIVQVVDQNDTLEDSAELLGFDIAAGFNYSLLGWHLEIDREPKPEWEHDQTLKTIQPLLKLVKAYFQPRLNVNGLFSDWSTAFFCLDCMMALQRVRPNLWENDDVVFDVVGLWLIPS
jgi:hypothetical protein